VPSSKLFVEPRFRATPRLAPAVINDRLAEWRKLLRSSVTTGRTVFQRILRGRVTFVPRLHVLDGSPDGYEFHAETRFDRLFSGIAVTCPWPTDDAVTGAEGITAADTDDADYGHLLEKVAARKGDVRPARLELATSWFVARRSIQLS
jgi:hypothetical protein